MPIHQPCYSKKRLLNGAILFMEPRYTS